ncbi:unnamed protein product [Prunus armeniaca]
MFNLQGRLCQIFGRKSQSLVSGPSIRLMSVIRQGSSRILRKFGVGLVKEREMGGCMGFMPWKEGGVGTAWEGKEEEKRKKRRKKKRHWEGKEEEMRKKEGKRKKKRKKKQPCEGKEEEKRRKERKGEKKERKERKERKKKGDKIVFEL